MKNLISLFLSKNQRQKISESNSEKLAELSLKCGIITLISLLPMIIFFIKATTNNSSGFVFTYSLFDYIVVPLIILSALVLGIFCGGAGIIFGIASLIKERTKKAIIGLSLSSIYALIFVVTIIGGLFLVSLNLFI